MSSSYKPESPSSYKKDQIILNSGRLLLNANEDSILLFSNKAIAFSSSGTINFDCDNDYIVNAPRIDLGLNATEPLLLGNQTINSIKRLIEQITILCKSLVNLTGVPVGIPILPVNLAANTVLENLNQIITQLDKLKSKQNFTL